MRRILLALILSIVITFVLITAYAFFPLIALWLRLMSGSAETGGVAAVAGGVRTTTFLLIWPIVFVVLFLLLQRKRTNP